MSSIKLDHSSVVIYLLLGKNCDTCISRTVTAVGEKNIKWCSNMDKQSGPKEHTCYFWQEGDL